jgi:tetratricopeptide (TPR) repeat protein
MQTPFRITAARVSRGEPGTDRRTLMNRRRNSWLGVLILGVISVGSPARATDRVPITTASVEAKQLYLEARDLIERLRVTDSRARFLEAIAKDPDFALAHLGLTGVSATTNEFYGAIQRAVALSGNVSAAERMMILGVDAGLKARPDLQKQNYVDLVALYPDDERVRSLLGNYFFGTQDYRSAIEQYEEAIKINPNFAPTYNQLGYAYRLMNDYPKAERAFRKYIDLIPGDPNPYDSYGEFLMKTGRFEESIQAYENALKVAPNFIPSYVGICNNRIFLGSGDDARAACDRLLGVSRTVGEKRQGLFWKSVSLLHDGRPDEAIGVVREMTAISEKDNDLATISGDFIMTGNILLESGRLDEASVMFRQAVETIDRAAVPDEVKDTAHRAYAYQEARVLLARGAVDDARDKVAEYSKLAASRGLPFELRQAHELAGRLALLEKRYKVALAELEKAGQQNPQVLYLEALACAGNGDSKGAIAFCESAANFYGLDINYAYVRKLASDMLAKLRAAK